MTTTLDADPTSILTLYRELIALRRREPAFTIGSVVDVACTDNVLSYTRKDDAGWYRVILNLNHEARSVSVPEGRLALSTTLRQVADTAPATLLLGPDEGVILSLSAPSD